MPPIYNVPFHMKAVGGVDELLLKSALLSVDVDALLLPSPIEVTESVVPDYSGFAGQLYSICYDLIPFLFADRYLSDPSTRSLYGRRLRNIRNADVVFAISESTRIDTIEHLNVAPENVINIGSAVSPFFKPVASEEREKWRAHIASRFGVVKPFILYTGGEDWRKNIEGLVEGYAKLSAPIRREHQLVVACRITEHGMKLLHELAATLGLSPDSLVLTNYVTDEELRAFYSLCDLFVFPSIYEGFGLPLAEAMACGAAVIAGDNSSLKEIVTSPAQLFDAHSTDAIADRMDSILGNSDLRRSLAAAAPVRAADFNWERVASRVQDVLLKTPRRDRTASPLFRRPLPRANESNSKVIAFFSPFRPLQSGVSDYSEEILPALADGVDVDLYVDEGYTPLVETGRTHNIYKHTLFESNLRRRDYSAIIYQMGNSLFHAYMYAYLTRFAGISVLHDYNMSGMVYHTQAVRPDLGITLAAELEHAYGDARAREIQEDMRVGKYGVGELPAQGIYTNRRIFTRSLGVIVHNQWSYDMAMKEHADDNPFITLIPPVMPPVSLDYGSEEIQRLRYKYGIPKDAFVVASCGIVAVTKRPLPTLDAFKIHLATHPNAFLVFVGSVEMPGVDFDGEIRRRGLQDRVKISGYVNIETFNEYLRLSDICLTLRFPSNGETSGALIRMLVNGKPSIVTNIGSFADFPDDIVHKLPTPDRGDEIGELTRALARLSDDDAYRTGLSQRAVAYMHREHSPERCARLYHQFIDQVANSPITRSKLLADSIGRDAATLMSRDQPLAPVFDAFAWALELGASS